jgi:hypothetical protein
LDPRSGDAECAVVPRLKRDMSREHGDVSGIELNDQIALHIARGDSRKRIETGERKIRRDERETSTQVVGQNKNFVCHAQLGHQRRMPLHDRAEIEGEFVRSADAEVTDAGELQNVRRGKVIDRRLHIDDLRCEGSVRQAACAGTVGDKRYSRCSCFDAGGWGVDADDETRVIRCAGRERGERAAVDCGATGVTANSCSSLSEKPSSTAVLLIDSICRTTSPTWTMPKFTGCGEGAQGWRIYTLRRRTEGAGR